MRSLIVPVLSLVGGGLLAFALIPIGNALANALTGTGLSQVEPLRVSPASPLPSHFAGGRS